MIIVTGTKRSGTSMWMQILKAAGYPVLGEAFPGEWGTTIREANQEGFYESHLRRGIYYATNPHPQTGRYLRPDETERAVVKVFIPGLVRSDLAFIHKVVATMRHHREYAASVERLFQMERQGKRALRQARGKKSNADPEGEPALIPPLLEWWNENYALLRDALVRRYPLHMVSYARILEEPEPVLSQTLRWLGGGDLKQAVACVRAQLQTQRAPEVPNAPTGLDATVEQVFEELYRRVTEFQPLDAAFIERLNHTQDVLEPVIREAQAQARRRRKGEAPSARASTAK